MLNFINPNLDQPLMNTHKVSQYAIFSDAVINGGYSLVYSTSAAALHAIKSDVVDKLQQSRLSELDELTIKKLIENGILVESHVDELKEILYENTLSATDSSLLYQVIAPSSNCQLGCNYCGQSHTKEVIEQSMEPKIMERITANLQKKNYKDIFIGWFGGEPLMGLQSIRSLSKQLLELAKKHGCSYGSKIVTNGLSLKPNIFFELFETWKVNTFEVTLDGTANAHDKRRYTKSKEATFNIIISNLREIISDSRFKKGACKIIIRCNVDKSNYEEVPLLIELLKTQGILDHAFFYTAAIHSWGNDAHLGSMSQDEYADFQIDTYIKLRELGQIDQTLPTQRKKQVCISTSDHGEVFDASGDVFDCTEVSLVPAYKDLDKYKVGKLYDESFTQPSRTFSSWNDDILKGEVPCTKCEILPICGGACPKLWKEGISPCPAIKHNIRNRMILDFSATMKILKENNIEARQDVLDLTKC